MKRKLSEKDATLYYEQIDYEAYEDVARSKKGGTFVDLIGRTQRTSPSENST